MFFVPKDFVKEVYGENTANGIIDTIVYDGSSYVELNGVIVAESNKKLSSLENNTYIISYKTSLFNSLDTKLTDLLNTGLTDGKYPTRPE